MKTLIFFAAAFLAINCKGQSYVSPNDYTPLGRYKYYSGLLQRSQHNRDVDTATLINAEQFHMGRTKETKKEEISNDTYRVEGDRKDIARYSDSCAKYKPYVNK